MAGQQLYQLQQACLGLKSTYDAVLVAAGLTPTVAWSEMPVSSTKALRAPNVTVTLEGGRRRGESVFGDPNGVMLVPVTFTVSVDGDEADALRYEGLLQSTVAGATSVLRAAVTDATLQFWTFDSGESGGDEDVRNRRAWESGVTMLAELET